MTTQSPDATEQVARAIANKRNEILGLPPAYWSDGEWNGTDLVLTPFERDLYRAEATAAIAALPSNTTTNASLVEALEMARRLCDQVRLDLASAHAEICKLQGLDPATHSWPGWTPQANTLRWLDDDLIPQFDTALATLRPSNPEQQP